MILQKCEGHISVLPYVLHLAQDITLSLDHGMCNGREILATNVPEDLEAMVRSMYGGREPKWLIIEDGGAIAFARHGDTEGHHVVAVTVNSVIAGAREAARGMGWSDSDLEGTGEQDNPGPEGGTSLATGLFLAQMIVCSPPADWDTLKDHNYPWDIQGWGPPLEFRPPKVPAKPKGEVPPDGEVVHDPTAGQVEDKAAAALEGVTKADGTPVVANADGTLFEGAPVVTELGLAEEQPPPADDDLAMVRESVDTIAAHPLQVAGVDPAQIDMFVQVYNETTAEGAGAVPSRQKLQHRFKRAGLPNLNAEQYEILVALAD